MDHLNQYALQLELQNRVRHHRDLGTSLRVGQPSFAVVLIAATMGAFARSAGRVERWARGEAQGAVSISGRTTSAAR